MLHAFARAEQGSLIDLLQAARMTDSPERRTLYVRHALDEARHAHMFAQAAATARAQAGLHGLGDPRADTEQLFERLGETGFLAFVHHSERRGRMQFEGYRDHFARAGNGRLRALFETILTDERRHEEYSWELLVDVSGGEARARRALARARRWELWRGWRRLGRFLADRFFLCAAIALYVLIAPLGLAFRWRRPKRGWQIAPPARGASRSNPEAR